jgi:site-specific DNA-methyltransferase (adenine-specific)
MGLPNCYRCGKEITPRGECGCRDGICLVCGDCREVLPLLEAGSIDLVLTDPPYGTQTHNGARTRTNGANSRVLVTFDSVGYQQVFCDFSEMVRVSRGWVVATCEWRFAARLEEDGLPLTRFGVWVKPNSAPQLSGDRPAMGWEAVLCFKVRSDALWNGGGRRAVWTCNRVNATLHPTEKPIELYKEWIWLFSGDGSLVLDPFAGSGTTGRACKDLGRKCILIEREMQYCEIAAKRLEQQVLFT